MCAFYFKNGGTGYHILGAGPEPLRGCLFGGGGAMEITTRESLGKHYTKENLGQVVNFYSVTLNHPVVDTSEQTAEISIMYCPVSKSEVFNLNESSDDFCP